MFLKILIIHYWKSILVFIFILYLSFAPPSTSQGHAHLATSSAKKVLAENLKQRAHKEEKVVNDAKALAEALKAIEIKIFAKAGGEKLFGSITNIDIAEALAKGGQVIDRKFITSGIVKRTGKYAANVRLHRDVIVELPYEIVAEK